LISVPTTVDSPSENEKGNRPVTHIWQKESTLLLIEHYKSYQERVNSGFITKKAVWDQICLKMTTKGYQLSTDQIQGRWKSLCRAYKNVKDYNNKSGNDRKHYEYENELDQVFGDDPLISPKVVSSSLKRKKLSLDDFEKGGQATLPGASTDQEEIQEPDRKKSKKLGKSNSNDVLGFLKDFVNQQEQKNEKRSRAQRKNA